MEPRPRQRLKLRPPPQHGDPYGDDRISALPDDMLLQVLVRLRCACAAARTGLLSRRWRGLWAGLSGLTFHNVSARKIKSALAHIARRTAVSLLEIRLMPSVEGKLDDAHAKSLLRSAARLSPEEIVFVLPEYHVVKRRRCVTMVLPCFHRATSIEVDTRSLTIMPPQGAELPLLETLSISGNIVDIGAFLNCCPRLRVLGVTFRGVDPGSLESELTIIESEAALGLTVSRLGIEFNNWTDVVDGAQFAALLRVAARLCPRELLFTTHFFRPLDADLLCFHRTTSIEMDFYDLRFTQLLPGEFSALETLNLKGCTIIDLVAMIAHCPRLRVLNATIDKCAHNVTVHSMSLEDLGLNVRDTECQSIHIVTPLLKKLRLNVHGKTNIGVSIYAPMVENVSWWSTYTWMPLIFGFWCLHSLRLEMRESYIHKYRLLKNDEEGVCSQFPRVHVLSMNISSYVRSPFM
jgi:hypothetical protein